MAEQDLQCPECKSPFSLKGRSPKTLPCLHTFCVDCLKVEFTDERKPFVSCRDPSCGSSHPLETGKDLRSGLKTDYFLERASARFQALTRSKARCDMCSQPDNEAKFYCDTCRKVLCDVCINYHMIMNETLGHEVNQLEGMLEASVSGSDPLVPFVTKKRWKCEDHLEGETNVDDVCTYCMNCDKMICLMCAATRHTGHNMVAAYEALRKPDYNVEQYLAELEQIRDNYAAAVDSTNNELEDLERVWRTTGENIKGTTTALQEQLKDERDGLKEKVKNIHDARVGEITKELEALAESRKRVNHSIDYVKNTLLCIPEDILEQEGDMIKWLEQLQTEFAKHPREPSQRDVFVRTTDPVDLNDVIGSVHTNPDLTSLIKGIDQVPFTQGKKTEFRLTCLDQIGIHLPSTNFEVVAHEVRPDVEEFSIRNSQNGTYTVTLQPRGCGEHSIHLGVQLHDKLVQLEPATVVVSPALLPEVQVTRRIQCNREMISPAGIAVNGRNIAITDKVAHKLFILTLEGDVLNVIGEEGNRECEFNMPQGVDWWGEDLVVADTGNNRIQVLSMQGVFFSEFGQLGGHDEEFMMPTDVAVSVSQENATLFVADSVNCRIQFFKMTDVRRAGELVGVYTYNSKPLSVCTDSQNKVFVVDNIGDNFKILSLKDSEENKPQSDPSLEPQDDLLWSRATR